MKIKLLLTGKTADPGIRALCADYAGRINRYAPFEIETVSLPKKLKTADAGRQMAEEGRLLLSKIDKKDFVILLDEKGKEMTSVEFARFLGDLQNRSTQRLVFITGGAYGAAPEVKKRADITLSLSPMTFPHQLVRLVFVEQLYRAFTILRGEGYHH